MQVSWGGIKAIIAWHQPEVAFEPKSLAIALSPGGSGPADYTPRPMLPNDEQALARQSLIPARDEKKRRAVLTVRMGKRDKHPFEDNPFVEGLFECMGSPAGELCMEIRDVLLPITDEVRLDAEQRLFLWPAGQRLSFDHSIERLPKQFPDFTRKNIASHLIFWIDTHAPEDYSETQLEELDRLTAGWTDELERQYMAD